MTAVPHNAYDIDTLAKTLWGEARGELRAGQIAVAWVIRNRAQRPAFAGKTLNTEGAVSHACRAPWQFSCWNSDDPNCAKLLTLKPEEIVTQTEIAADVLDGVIGDPTGGADHYFAVSIDPPYWARGMKQTARIGHHIFFNSQYKSRPILAMGIRDPNVTLVQEALVQAGFYLGPAAGIFDSDTYDAVRKYQAIRKLSVDGVVGPQTYASLGIN